MLDRLANVIYWIGCGAAALWVVMVLGSAGILSSGFVLDGRPTAAPVAAAENGPWTQYAPGSVAPAQSAQPSALPPGFVLDANPLSGDATPGALSSDQAAIIMAVVGAFLIWLASWAIRYVLKG